VIFLSPIPSLGESLSGLTSGVPTVPDGDGFNGYEKVASESFIKGIRKAVANDYKLKEENIEVRINGFTLNTMRADEIYIVLYGYAVLSDTSRIKEFVDKNFLNEGGYSEGGIEIG
jgi:hypothetical protein